MAAALSPKLGEGPEEGKGAEGTVSTEEWQAWGTASPLPEVVKQIIHDFGALECDLSVPMPFGGPKLQGSFKVQEDKKNRAVYKTLDDSERKLQYFSARQIACRLLGSRRYLCQKLEPASSRLQQLETMLPELEPAQLSSVASASASLSFQQPLQRPFSVSAAYSTIYRPQLTFSGFLSR